MSDFQKRVDDFVTEAFSPVDARSVEERTYRFVEEALELAQSTGCTREEAMRLVEYVFSRPVGERWQEAGGTMLTLCALCTAVGLDHEECGERELERARGKIDVIRQKHLSKPRRSPLPGQVKP